MSDSTPDIPFAHHTVQAGELAMHYVECGEGPPLVLLHGFPQHWWMWRRVMPLLARQFRVIAVDQRGMGGTAITPGGYDKTTLARDLHALMATLGIARAHVCGYDQADFEVYVRQLQKPGALRAGLSYFASVFDDTEQVKAFAARPLPMPALGLGGERGAAGFVLQALQRLASQAEGGVLAQAGHWLADEQPQALAERTTAFLLRPAA